MSVQWAKVCGTGTSVGPSALIAVNSRVMSCAVACTWPSGGRRTIHHDVPSVTS